MSPPRRRDAFADMTAAQAAAEHVGDDAEAVAGACPYEADLLDADALREIGFYPDPDVPPPF